MKNLRVSQFLKVLLVLAIMGRDEVHYKNDSMAAYLLGDHRYFRGKQPVGCSDLFSNVWKGF